MDAAWAKWVARFDLEALVSWVLWYGMLAGLGLLLLSVGTSGWGGAGQELVGGPGHGDNLLHWLLLELRRYGEPALRPALYARLGLAVFMLTPYARVAASLVYFTIVDHRPWYAGLRFVVFAILTYILMWG